MAHRGGNLVAVEDEALLGDLGIGDLVHIRCRRMLLQKQHRRDARVVALPLALCHTWGVV
jgi:hypothetical protein